MKKNRPKKPWLNYNSDSMTYSVFTVMACVIAAVVACVIAVVVYSGHEKTDSPLPAKQAGISQSAQIAHGIVVRRMILRSAF